MTPNILSIYQKCSIIFRKAALCITWLKKLVDSVVPLFEREQALTKTPLPLGTSAARSFVRVGAADCARELDETETAEIRDHVVDQLNLRRQKWSPTEN